MMNKNSAAVNEPLTVLMPVYNASPYLRGAIESILVQTYRQFELLIIDDASTDNSREIIRSFADDRIRLISHPKNIGIKDTLNEGIDLANTELIARMDADDISHPWRLQKQADYLLQHRDCAMVSSLARVVDKDGNFMAPYDPYRLDTYYGLYFDCYICHPAVMYRKSCVESAGKYSTPYSEDFDLWWKLSRLYKIYVLPEPLLLYRLHEQNYSRVLKRDEYDQAEFNITRRNLHYLLGERVQIPQAYIACYNYEFNPLIQLNDMEEMKKCIDMLTLINGHIFSIENPNRKMESILHAAGEKKKDVLFGLGKNLSYIQMLKLLLHYKYYRLIWQITFEKAVLNLNAKVRMLKEMKSKKRKFSLRPLLWKS